MGTVTRTIGPPTLIEDAPAPSRVRRLLVAGAGPLLIIGSVLIALRGIAFLPHLTDQHPDLLTFWLPRSCMLGRAIADGHVPLWNPFEMIGTPFAADPQSGWLALPTMLLSWLFGCGGGLRALIVLNPILAGIGLFWFLRKEGLGRIAATAGGLSVAMAISASILAISLPFAGTLAWTPLMLAGASGFFSASGLRRLAWLTLSALSWGQVATAHLSHGLVMATGLTLAYVIARAVREIRRQRLPASRAVWLAIAFVAFLPLANLAILVPRFAILARSSLAEGYGDLRGTVPPVSGGPEQIPVPATGIWAAWPLALASTPGGYLGAGILLFVPFAIREARRRYLILALGTVGLVGYLLTTSLLVAAGWFRSFVLALPYGDVYLHNPSRLRYLAFLIVPTLGAVGIQWLLDHRPSFWEAMRWILVGLAILLFVPLALGARVGRLTIFALAAVAVVAVVWALTRGRRWAPLALCGLLTAELLAGAVWSSVYGGGTVFFGLESGDQGPLVAAPLRWPAVDLERYLQPGPIAQALQDEGPQGGRYLAWIRPDAYFNKGYLFTRKESDWPALLIGRSVLFEIRDTLGYSPVQLPGYWSFIHATNRLPVFYNAAVIQVPTLSDLRLLGARYLILPQGEGLPAGLFGRTVEVDSAYRLVQIDGTEPRASVVPAWRVVDDRRSALDAILDRGFDPGEIAVLEHDPAQTSSGGGAGWATYRELEPEDVRIQAQARVPSILVVRNAWDPGWSATLDGRAAPVLRTDAFLQGIAIPPGRHEIHLVYREPMIGRGLVLSALVWLALLVLAAIWLAMARRGAVRATDEVRDGSHASDGSGPIRPT